ncbi:MAG: hypothetical protein WA131_03980, partial [Desulfitobacteriaceae bacterium]
MRFFLTEVEEIGLKFSPFPEMDKFFFKRETEYLSPGLPLAFLETIVSETMSKAKLKLKLSKELKRHGDFLGYSSCIWQKAESLTGLETFEEVWNNKTREFGLYIRGHQLTENELGRLAVQIGLDFEDLMRLAHQRVLKGQGEWVPAVRQEGKKWRCQRCGETELEEWSGVWGRMATCRSCTSLGVSSSQQVLYRDKETLEKATEAVRFILQPSLTSAQE